MATRLRVSSLLLILWTAAHLLVQGQTQIPPDAIDYDELINSIVRNETITTAAPSTIQPVETSTENNAAIGTKLACPDPTICVPYYLCGNGTLTGNELNLDDPTNPCHYLYKCCPLHDIREERISSTLAPPPSSSTSSSSQPPTPTQPISPPVKPIDPQPSPPPTAVVPAGPTSTIRKCGIRYTDGVAYKITNARDNEAEFGEFPWMVALFKQSELLGIKTMVYACGGSIIHPRVVLTAAHCVLKKPTLMARAGEWDTQTEAEALPSQERRVTEIITHEGFYKGGLFNDIALLIVDEPFDFSADNVGPICLPKANANYDSITCTASGWGAHKPGGQEQTLLKKIDLPIVPRDHCQTVFREWRKSTTYELHPSYMCAGGLEGRDTCKGDGGSPLACPTTVSREQYIQAGIVSWGRGCGSKGVPGVYASVINLRPWIDETMQKKNMDTIYYEF